MRIPTATYRLQFHKEFGFADAYDAKLPIRRFNNRGARRISMKEDARKNLRRRKRQKRRLAMRKYIAEKKSKAVVA
jgi:hypothetical protein